MNPGNESGVMKGLELARRYWEECGRPMLAEFPELSGRVAAGLCGSGSECFGYDDEVSRDHDFEPGFLLFLPPDAEETIDRRTLFRLERAYDALPKEFRGVKRERMIPTGGQRHGVMDPGAFFRSKCGSPDGRLTTADWLRLPEESLAEAVNGEIFYDPSGEVTKIRARLAQYPEDVRRKKLAGNLLLMHQAGLYNYPRILRHGEEASAQLAAVEFVGASMRAVFLLNRRYRPFYKWAFRALRELPVLGELADSFAYLLTSENDGESARVKSAVMEDVCALILAQTGPLLPSRTVISDPPDPESAAYALNAEIADEELRNLHILAGV